MNKKTIKHKLKMSEKAKMAFLEAAYERDYAGMKAALEDGDEMTLYSEDARGNTALHYAVFCANASLNNDKFKQSSFLALCYCASLRALEGPHGPLQGPPGADRSAQDMVIFLLTWEAEEYDTHSLVNKVNKDGWAPINYTTELNLIETVKTLIKWGANVNTTPEEGMKHHGDTPLINALYCCKWEIAEILLNAGAKGDIYEKDNGHPWTALSLACTHSKTNIANMILKRGKDEITQKFVNITNENGESALTFAIANGLSEVIQDLLSHGANLYKQKGDIDSKMHNIDPQSFQKFLDDQITVEKLKDNKEPSKKVTDTQINLNYERIHNTEEKKEVNESANMLPQLHIHTETHFLEDMVKLSPEHKKLLKHPLCMALLRRKWKQIENLYYVWMFTKMVFLGLLLALAIIQGPVLKNCLRTLNQNTTCTSNNMTKGMICGWQEGNLKLNICLVKWVILLWQQLWTLSTKKRKKIEMKRKKKRKQSKTN